jgi:hypothetical protein
VIYTRARGNRIPYCHIHYISDVNQWPKFSGAIRSAIAKSGKTPFVIVDSRLVREVGVPYSYDLPFRSFRLYRSPSLEPKQIDNLYSELVLLKLNIVPTLRRIGQELLTSFVSRRFDPYRS